MVMALVVEDEAALQIIYERLLHAMGFEVIAARDGVEALEVLTHHTPQIIFLDMLLPRLSGVQVIEYIAQLPTASYIHVVMISSASEYERYVSYLPSAEFFLKPVSANQIRVVAQRSLPANR